MLKRKGGVIDYTLLKKKGFLEDKSETDEINKTEKMKTDKEGFLDLGDSPSPFDFLDNTQNSGISSDRQPLPDNSDSGSGNSEISELRIKLDDAEYKIKLLEDRIKELEKNWNQSH